MVGEVMAVIKKLASEGMTMAIVTHEMTFAREVASYVYCIDDGVIYEQGTPDEIFNYPKREKTRAFIHRIKSFHYEIESKDFDFIDMMNSLSNFCYNHAVSKSNFHKLQLVTEELVINLLLQKNVKIVLNINFLENQNSYEIDVSYTGERYNPFEENKEDLSVTIIAGTAKDINYKFEDKNELQIIW